MASTGNTLLALITGAAIGAGVGLLYAPDSGDKTRKKLKKDAQQTRDNLNKRYHETSSNLSEKAKKARVDFEVRLEETLSSASHKADDILAAMETKLEELRKQNAKLQKDKSSKSGGKSPDKAVV
ncbi:YtxH domain-containing protein [Christiangramia sediminis]|uniref:YtxH domain-containing protein n=1 Tax=Christiangramia sediminis TaxID=2881336 RepID=A0A9X1LKA5_9FLAO|nr:YtxH domain-containing protein [Christiangramia sediminis]MCB7481903.1 YtxH domain-containing protein [Christiangramia sediminis]